MPPFKDLIYSKKYIYDYNIEIDYCGGYFLTKGRTGKKVFQRSRAFAPFQT